MIFGNRKKIAALTDRIAALKEERKALKNRVKELERTRGTGDLVAGVPLKDLCYNSDGLSVWGKNLAFLEEARFKEAYRKGVASGHRFTTGGAEFHIEWRVHVAIWAAGIGLRLDGDFVECGVNTGILSLAIADYHRFSECDRVFHLFDTFNGIPEEQMAPEEREKKKLENRLFYPDCYEQAKENFAPYPNMKLIRGRVPDTLESAKIGKVAYLSIDMNVAEAELAAIQYFWEKLVPGAPVVLDDYGWSAYEPQKRVLDAFAEQVGTSILTLPTGQGLMIKC